MFQVFSKSAFLVATISFHYFEYASAFQGIAPRTRFGGASSFLRSSNVQMKSSIDLDEIETNAVRASENWDITLTPFLNDENAQLVEERLASRADVKYIKIGGLPSSVRKRFVMTNPDLELDVATIEEEYCTLLCVDNIDTARMPGSSPWPHVLTKIGVDLENVGDVVVEDSNAYLSVVPQVAKQCCRLLPKELKGVGITVSVLESGEYIPFDGMQQNMQMGKLDKRALKYNN